MITRTDIETHVTAMALKYSELLMRNVVNVLDFLAESWDSWRTKEES